MSFTATAKSVSISDDQVEGRERLAVGLSAQQEASNVLVFEPVQKKPNSVLVVVSAFLSLFQFQRLGFVGASFLLHLLLGLGFYLLDSSGLAMRQFETRQNSVLTWINVVEPVVTPPSKVVESPKSIVMPIKAKRVHKKVIAAKPRSISQKKVVKKVPAKVVASMPAVLSARVSNSSFKVEAKPAEQVVTNPSSEISRGKSAATISNVDDVGSVDLRQMTKDWVSAMGSMIRHHALRDYPMRARKMGIEGTVILSFWMDKSGKVQSVRVKKSSGHTVLDKAALASLSHLDHLPRPPSEIRWRSRRAISMPITYRLH